MSTTDIYNFKDPTEIRTTDNHLRHISSWILRALRRDLDEDLAISTLEVERSSFAGRGGESIGEDSSQNMPGGVQLPLGGRGAEHYPWKGEECMPLEDKNGTIVRINDRAGFGYVWEEGSDRQYIFNLSKVPGYHGQSARELNVKMGSRVHFQIEDEIVKSLKPL